jgi:hypothetical protein
MSVVSLTKIIADTNLESLNFRMFSLVKNFGFNIGAYGGAGGSLIIKFISSSFSM